jgi:hypothetical protein
MLKNIKADANKHQLMSVLPLLANTIDTSLYSRGSEFILNTVPYRNVAYRTVPYRFPLEHYSRSQSLSARRTVFLPKIHSFSAKKVTSANRTVFQIKTVLAF